MNRLGWFSLVVLAACCLGGPGFAQDDGKPEPVRFSSIDGVELRGQFWTGKRLGSTVLLLHALGEDSRKNNWSSLADALQKKGFSVLAFDFRGHGNSTEVATDKFWANTFNRTYVKGYGKSIIDFKNFDKARYYPSLVNDIAAARAFLDRAKNDTETCNTSSLFLVGAETGATLGAIWLNSEYYRHRLIPPPTIGLQPSLEPTPEGRDIIGTVWLSISSTLGSRPPVNLSQVLDVPVRGRATASVFFYSEGDDRGKTVALNLQKNLKLKDEKYRYIAAVPVKGNSKLTGVNLLQKSLGTEDAIIEYLEEVSRNRGHEWIKKDFVNSLYFWRLGSSMVPAKNNLGEKTLLVWDSYEKFIR